MRGASIFGGLLLAATLAYIARPDGAAAGSTAGVPNERTYRIGDTADHVRITVFNLSHSSTEAIVVVTIDPGYHVNANPASQDYLIPTTLKVTNEMPLRVIYPAPALFKPKFTNDALKVYEGTIDIVAEFPRGTFTHESRLFGTLTAQACTDDVCLPPADLPLPSSN